MANSFQILQINVISARDLSPVSKSMSTYAMIWIDPTRKMRTRVDQDGNNSPQWNDKFPFRLSSEFLHSDSANVSIEIYSVSWIRDTIVGSVRVPVSGIIPANPNRQARRAVALQIRRPSGRPRGILNITVSLLDGSMQSMPLSGLGVPEAQAHAQARPDRDQKSDVASSIRRVKSERSSVIEETGRPRSMCNGSEVLPGGSMCNSDVGPSPSVVAAAVAKGLYLPPVPQVRGGGITKGVKDDGESSILQWADEESEEGVMTKIERWKTELNRPIHGGERRHRRVHRRQKSEGVRLFRCFGKGYGFEFTIVCGANHNENKIKNNNNNGKKVHRKRLHFPPSDADSSSQSYVPL